MGLATGQVLSKWAEHTSSIVTKDKVPTKH